MAEWVVTFNRYANRGARRPQGPSLVSRVRRVTGAGVNGFDTTGNIEAVVEAATSDDARAVVMDLWPAAGIASIVKAPTEEGTRR
jgi:hypothetical protein